MADRLTLGQLGAALGISKQAVSKAAAKGMPVESIEAAKAWRRENLDVSRAKASRAAINSAPADPSAAAEEEEGLPDSAEYKRHRTERERIRKEREQLELDERRGSLVDVSEAQRLAYTAFRALRDAVLNVPARVKDACAAQTEAAAIEQLLDDELTSALAGFNVDQVLKEIDDDDDDAA